MYINHDVLQKYPPPPSLDGFPLSMSDSSVKLTIINLCKNIEGPQPGWDIVKISKTISGWND